MSRKQSAGTPRIPTYDVKRVILRVSTDITHKDTASADISVFPFDDKIILDMNWRCVTDDDSMKLTWKGQMGATMTREQARALVDGLRKSLREKRKA